MVCLVGCLRILVLLKWCFGLGCDLVFYWICLVYVKRFGVLLRFRVLELWVCYLWFVMADFSFVCDLLIGLLVGLGWTCLCKFAEGLV